MTEVAHPAHDQTCAEPLVSSSRLWYWAVLVGLWESAGPGQDNSPSHAYSSTLYTYVRALQVGLVQHQERRVPDGEVGESIM